MVKLAGWIRDWWCELIDPATYRDRSRAVSTACALTEAEQEQAQAVADSLAERFDYIDEQLLNLRELLSEPMPTKAAADPGMRRSVAMRLSRGDADTAARARVGKAARRNGMSYKAWTTLHGPRETDPEVKS